VFLNVPVLQQPEAYIGDAGNVFDAEGKLTNERTRELMKKFIHAYAGWVEAHAKKG